MHTVDHDADIYWLSVLLANGGAFNCWKAVRGADENENGTCDASLKKVGIEMLEYHFLQILINFTGWRNVEEPHRYGLHGGWSSQCPPHEGSSYMSHKCGATYRNVDRP